MCKDFWHFNSAEFQDLIKAALVPRTPTTVRGAGSLVTTAGSQAANSLVIETSFKKLNYQQMSHRASFFLLKQEVLWLWLNSAVNRYIWYTWRWVVCRWQVNILGRWKQHHLKHSSAFLHFQLQKAKTSEADEADEEPTVVQSAQVFAPKSLVLVSRLDHTDVFKVQCSTFPKADGSCTLYHGPGEYSIMIGWRVCWWW